MKKYYLTIWINGAKEREPETLEFNVFDRENDWDIVFRDVRDGLRDHGHEVVLEIQQEAPREEVT